MRPRLPRGVAVDKPAHGGIELLTEFRKN